MTVNFGGGLWRYESSETNAKATGATTIFTTDANARFYPVLIVIEMVVATGIGTSAVITVGTNSPTYDNILAAKSPGLIPNAAEVGAPLASGVSIAPSTDVKANVTVGAIGVSGTFKAAIL